MAILHCYAFYNKIAQTHSYITDPTTSQNAQRAPPPAESTGGDSPVSLQWLPGARRRKQSDANNTASNLDMLWRTNGTFTQQQGELAETLRLASIQEATCLTASVKSG